MGRARRAIEAKDRLRAWPNYAFLARSETKSPIPDALENSEREPIRSRPGHQARRPRFIPTNWPQQEANGRSNGLFPPAKRRLNRPVMRNLARRIVARTLSRNHFLGNLFRTNEHE